VLKPQWDKAWWRKASALKGLRQYVEALEAFRISYELVPDKETSHKTYRLAVTVRRSIARRAFHAIPIITLVFRKSRNS
jgi:hypothetical protein